METNLATNKNSLNTIMIIGIGLMAISIGTNLFEIYSREKFKRDTYYGQ